MAFDGIQDSDCLPSASSPVDQINSVSYCLTIHVELLYLTE